MPGRKTTGRGKAAAKKETKPKGPSLDSLLDLADEMNEVMGLDPAIDLDIEDAEELKIEVANNALDENDVVQIFTTDEFSKESLATLKSLAIVPVDPEAATEPDAKEEEPDAKEEEAGADDLPTDEEVDAMEKTELQALIVEFDLPEALKKVRALAKLKAGIKEALAELEEAGDDPGEEAGADDLPTDEEVDAMDKPTLVALVDELELPEALKKVRALAKLKTGIKDALADLENADEPEEKKEEKPAKKGGKSTSKTEKKAPVSRYSRASAFADAVKEIGGDSATIDELATASDEIYTEKTGKAENLRESKWMANHGINILVSLELATMKGDKFTFKG